MSPSASPADELTVYLAFSQETALQSQPASSFRKEMLAGDLQTLGNDLCLCLQLGPELLPRVCKGSCILGQVVIHSYNNFFLIKVVTSQQCHLGWRHPV